MPVSGDLHHCKTASIKSPHTIAFMVSSVYAVCITRPEPEWANAVFHPGAANRFIMLMIWFSSWQAHSPKECQEISRAIDATVRPRGTAARTVCCWQAWRLCLFPSHSPSRPPIHWPSWRVSWWESLLRRQPFISDTTIAATRTQGCAMRDKFPGKTSW